MTHIPNIDKVVRTQSGAWVLLFEDTTQIHNTLEKQDEASLWAMLEMYHQFIGQPHVMALVQGPMLGVINMVIMVLCQKHGWTFVTLEAALRRRKLDIWLAAELPSGDVKNGTYVMRYFDQTQTTQPKYNLTTHLGRDSYALGKIKAVWKSYEANVKALAETGVLTLPSK